MTPAPEQVERFRRDIENLVPADARLGLAVSGGPDSVALLLLAAAARPGFVAAASVDHGLREGSRDEAEMVAALCGGLGVPHAILTVEWVERPGSAIQERARAERYRLLGAWARQHGCDAVVTAHQLEDQAETLLMRLSRGAGVRGLAAMRRVGRVPGGDLPLIRPLLGWRRSELHDVCSAAGVTPADDPSNADARFERVRVRRALAEADWLDAAAVARSAANLVAADSALHWVADQVWAQSVRATADEILFDASDLPREIRRRIVRRAVLRMASEGGGADLRGGELDRLLAALRSGGRATVRGVLCSGGDKWRFVPAPNRTRPVDKPR